MAKVLLVDSRHDTRSAWQAELEARGHSVATADTAFFVLTMMERNRPDIIVSHATLDDMEGRELCAIVRADPMTRQIRFVLLTDKGRASSEDALSAQVDSTLPDNVSPADLVRRVEEILLEAALASCVPPGDGTPEGADAGAGTEPVRGVLDVLDLFDVLQTLAETRQRGWLVLSLDGTKGAIGFNEGRPVHAAFRGETGRPAFINLGLASAGVRVATFQFLPCGAPRVPKPPVTIRGDVEKLVRRIAATVEEARRSAELSRSGDRQGVLA